MKVVFKLLLKDKSCVDLVAGKAGEYFSSPFFLYSVQQKSEQILLAFFVEIYFFLSQKSC